MPTFSYNALTSAGSNVGGEVVADHERAALRELKRRGLTPLSLAIAARPRQRRIGWRKRASLEEHFRLVNELAVMIEAGVSLSEAVEIASRSAAYEVFGDALAGFSRDLRRGLSVPDAIKNNITTFPPYVYRLIEAGNATGMLADSLKDAGLQMQFDDRIRKDIRNALIYPIFLICTGIASTSFIFIFVVPRFANMLKDRLALLPPFPRSIFYIGLFTNKNLPLLIAMVMLAAFGFYLLWRFSTFPDRLREFALRVPVFGTFLLEAEAGRWTAMLSTLLRNRVPLVQSLSLARDSLKFESLRGRLDQVEQAVRNGNTLAAALQDYHLFDETLINLIRVGERSGRLSDMLKSAADLAEQKGRDRIKQLMTMLEPAAILVIGGLIGVIVISLFMAITSMNNVRL